MPVRNLKRRPYSIPPIHRTFEELILQKFLSGCTLPLKLQLEVVNKFSKTVPMYATQKVTQKMNDMGKF
jgi:hypothetical protein